MNETERAALVDELAEAMMPEAYAGVAGTRQELKASISKHAERCLPVIERLLAAADAQELDALLDSVPNLEISETNKEGEYYAFGEMQWFDATADVRVYQDDDRSPDARYEVYIGTGPTRTEAIKAAVAQAAGITQEGTSDE